MSLKVGDPAPDFALPDQHGKVHRLSDYRGRYVVVYFYPKDFAPGCTREARAFNEALDALAAEGAVVLGISADDVERHKKFAEKLGLKFPLLADPEKKVIQAYGAWGTKNLYGKKVEGTMRYTFVLDPEGRILKIIKRAKPEEHMEKALAAIREAKGGA